MRPHLPHVFVVMPFGPKEVQSAAAAGDGAPARPQIIVDFDEIYELLIKPALNQAKCLPFRADKEPGAGDIRTDMYFELVTADAVLADISILNTNVFYELGIRHGVAPRGVFMIHGGWTRRPFDVAPDRTFDYEGKLFSVKKDARDETWNQQVKAAVEHLSTVLKGALDVDDQTTGSPVYSQLVGLKPVDWSNIQTTRAKYFGEVFTDWKDRVEVTKFNGCPRDILTLPKTRRPDSIAASYWPKRRLPLSACIVLMWRNPFLKSWSCSNPITVRSRRNWDWY